MKKVLFIATVQSHIINFHIPYINLLQKKGYEVHVATKLDKDRYNNVLEYVDNVVWKNIDFSRNPLSKDIFKSYKQIYTYINENKFDLIHVNTPIAAFLTRLAVKKQHMSPVIYTAHGFHFFKGAPIQNWIMYYPLEKIASKWSDAIITMNKEDYNISKLKFNNKRCSTYHINGIGVDFKKYLYLNTNDSLNKELNIESRDLVLSIIGEINKNKNQKQIIDAVVNLRSKYDNIKLLIVGDGDMYQEIASYIEEKNSQEYIKMLGFRRDIPEILSLSDIVVSCSYREGLPKNIIEAMISKSAIICTNVRGNKDLVTNMENGILVPVNDSEKMTQAIELLYTDRELLKAMGEKSYGLAHEYSLDKVLNQMESIYSIYL
jgi:glycosyltransferase involved in cell wall biosynthesis